MENVIITGGTGQIGTALISLLVSNGYQVTVLTRSLQNKRETPQVKYAGWDVANGTIDVQAVLQADHIIHLVGAGVVDKKWTASYKKEIIDSRTKSIELIIDTLKNNKGKVKTIVSASATGWYGADKTSGDAFEEDEPAASDFLGNTCQLWEQSSEPAKALGIRVCKLRSGMVLFKSGGALAEFKKPLRWGIASILGSGKQVMSWIHIDDLCRIYLACIKNTQMQGSYNAVANEPVSNAAFILKLAETLRGKRFIPIYVPAFILKIMMGDRSIEVLKSVTVDNEKLKATGFTFLYPTVETALNNLLK
ncbi:MAG: TIGR01777 family oxidoreductase [Bacteroidetes bacterium]|nr:TIGR01777 family oxidoreductase [Bacteroidota bacterium]